MKQHGIKEKHYQAVIQILRSHSRIEKAILFGSRAMQTYTTESDIDIALMGKDLTFTDQGELASRMEEINMAQSVDLLLYSAITNENLKKHIRRHGVVWYQRELAVGCAGPLLFKDAAILAGEKIDPANAVGKKYVGLEHIEPGSLVLSGYGYAEDVASSKATFKKGDILFGKLRPYFRKVVIAPFDGICSTDIWVVRAKKNVDQTFLYYWMASREFVDNATRASEGTRMPRAKWDYVGRFESPINDKNKQIAIGQVLKSLDDKIELNRQMCEPLEKTAATLFKSWFVDFDPVKAKATLKHHEKQNSSSSPSAKEEYAEVAEGDCDYLVSSTDSPPFKGWEQWNLQRAKAYLDKLDPVIADLFPDSFEDCKMGEIPKGWDVSVVYDWADYINGAAYKNIHFSNEENALPVIKIAELKNGIDSQTKYANTDLGGKYLLDTKELKVVKPSDKMLQAYKDLARPLYDRLQNSLEETNGLQKTRDTLLSKLISGELRVEGVR